MVPTYTYYTNLKRQKDFGNIRWFHKMSGNIFIFLTKVSSYDSNKIELKVVFEIWIYQITLLL